LYCGSYLFLVVSWFCFYQRIAAILHIVSRQTIIPLNGFYIYYFSIIFIEQPEKIVGYFGAFWIVGDVAKGNWFI